MAALRFRFRRGLPAEWTTANPVLAEGEPGVELRLDGADMMKVGDGATPWVDLPYVVGVEGQSGFVVEQGGVYPSRPIAGPVVFIGPDNPDDLGLMQVGDTWIDSDATEEAPVYALASEKGAANGLATLDSVGKVPAAQLPSYVDDVVEYATLAAFPATGTAGLIYVAQNTNKTYRWSGTAYTEISPSEVNSVAGKTGIVTLVAGDVGAHPAGGLLTDGMLPSRIRATSHTVTDWNTATENGFYYALSTAANAPTAANSIGYVHSNAAGTAHFQTVWSTSGTASDTIMWRRAYTASAWGAWYRLRQSETELDARYTTIGTTQNVTGLKIFNSGNVKDVRNLVQFGNSTSDNLGSLVVETNIQFNNHMCSLRIRGYNYFPANSIIDLTVNFYAYGTGPAFVNTSIINHGDYPVSGVRLMRRTSDSRVVVVVDTTTNWDYPKIVVDGTFGSSIPDADLTGWTATISSDVSAYTAMQTPTVQHNTRNDNTQTLTGKTISADNNTLSGIAASSFVLSNASGNIDGAAATKVIPAGVVVGTTDTQTLTNKTISLASNTVTMTKAQLDTAVTDSDIVDTTTTQTIGGAKTFSAALVGSSTITAGGTGFAGPGANITGISGSNVTSWNGVTTSNLWVRAQNDIVVWSGPATNDTAGELVLQTNVKTINKMVLIRFRGQSHTTRNIIDCVVRGYWSGTAGANTFLTTAVINYGNHRIASVRALRRISDDTLALALTPDPVAVGWDFAKMSVDAQVAYGGDQADILTGWSLNILTDTSAYAEIVNINPQNVAFTSEPDSLTVTGGAITLNNATSNLVNFGTAGLAAPAFTTRSAGTKLVIYNSVAADAVDYGIGVETGHMWFSASQAVGTRGFKWYGGTTSLATLTGTGNLTVTGTVTAGGTGFAGPGVNITTLNATNLTAGTVPDAALPARLRVETSLLTDANSATANGWYRIPITGTNIPDATSGWLIQAQANDTGALYVTQVAHGFSLDSSADTRTYRRELNNGTWGSWYRIWQSEVELDARYKNVGEAVTDAELPARLKATHNSDVPSGDWNMALDTGWYAHSFAANAPESSTAWHMGMVLAHNVGWVTQTVHRFTSDSSTNTETFQRDLNNGTWGAWYRLRLSEAELDARYARGEDSGWVAPTLSNGWVNYGSPYATAAYRKIGNRVTIKGLIKSGTVTSGTTVFTLPVGYRPTEILHLPIYANGAFAGVHLNTNGAVQADSGWQATWTSLSGISFLVD